MTSPSLLARLLTKAHIELNEIDEQLIHLVPGTQQFRILQAQMERIQDRIQHLSAARRMEMEREAA